MDVESARRALALFEQAIELPQEEVADWVLRECENEPLLEEEVQRLLDAHHDANDLLPTNHGGGDDSVPTRIVHDAALDSNSAASRLALGQLLGGRYEILCVLGAGGMGEVYRAHDQRLDRMVAIKVLNHAGLTSPHLRERFDRELRSVASLHHPNIVSLFDVSDDSDVTFAVMEYVDGRTIRQLIDAGMSWPTALRFGIETARGLATAHAKNLMHRDVKPENVIVTSSGVAKLLDFGLARPESQSADLRVTRGQNSPGTIPYMSPEQAENKPLTVATDVFSLGIVLYEMICGFNPFREANAFRTLQKIVEFDPRPIGEVVHGVSSEFTAVVMSMLERDPQKRPTASQIVDRLIRVENASSGDTIVKASTAQPARQPAREAKWQPSLVVMPFQAFDNDLDIESIADGLVQNLTTALTRVPMLSLTSRMSSHAMKGSSYTSQDVRNRFQVDFMIEGSIQRVGDQVCVNVQLIDTRDGFHLWAQPFECPLGDDTLTTLVSRVLFRVEPQLVRAIFNDLRDESGELSSRQLLVQGMSVLALKGWHRDSFEEVATMLHASIEKEPDFALTHAYLSLIYGLGHRVGLFPESNEVIENAIKHAEIAADLDSMDSNVLGLAGCAMADVGEFSRALPMLRGAINLNPNNAQGHAALGAALLTLGEVDASIEHLNEGIRISPLDGRLAVWNAMLAIACLQKQQLDKALDAARTGCESDRKSYLPRVVLTAIHLVRRDEENATVALQDCLRVKPDLSRLETERLIGRELTIAFVRLRRQIGMPETPRKTCSGDSESSP